jgi:hypothetical protein
MLVVVVVALVALAGLALDRVRRATKLRVLAV